MRDSSGRTVEESIIVSPINASLPDRVDLVYDIDVGNIGDSGRCDKKPTQNTTPTYTLEKRLCAACRPEKEIMRS